MNEITVNATTQQSQGKGFCPPPPHVCTVTFKKALTSLDMHSYSSVQNALCIVLLLHYESDIIIPHHAILITQIAVQVLVIPVCCTFITNSAFLFSKVHKPTRL